MDIFEYRAYNQDVRGKASGRRVFYRGERMTINEASERYSIPLDILKEYESWGLCGAVKKVMGAWQYDDGDIERLGTIMALHDIGLSSEEIEAYMRLTLEQGARAKRCCACLTAGATRRWMRFTSASASWSGLTTCVTSCAP